MSADAAGYDPAMDHGKAETMSASEQRLRGATSAIVKRVRSGMKPIGAITGSGYTKGQARTILATAAGGHRDVTDDGYRAACVELAGQIDEAMSSVDERLIERWHKLAEEGDDWRSIAELVKRRDPDEWAVTERSEVALDADVNVRGEDAVLAALARLKGAS